MKTIETVRGGRRPARRVLCAAVALLVLAPPACAGRKMMMEVSGTIMYEKPRIAQVTHILDDRRADGGAVVISVTMSGDSGLVATFDIHPGVVSGQPMKETSDGTYSGEFACPIDLVGGPFTLLVRLKHEQAGEVTWRDPNLITIPLADALEPTRGD